MRPWETHKKLDNNWLVFFFYVFVCATTNEVLNIFLVCVSRKTRRCKFASVSFPVRFLYFLVLQIFFLSYSLPPTENRWKKKTEVQTQDEMEGLVFYSDFVLCVY